MIPPGIVNSNLTWVSTTTKDLGLDLDMWKGKLGFVFDVFKRDEIGELAHPRRLAAQHIWCILPAGEPQQPVAAGI